jgi:uncharacterized membrane protein
MATTAVDPDGTRREISFERVFGLTFGTIRSNPLGTLGIAFLFSALPLLAFNYLAQSFRSPEAMMRLGVWGIVGEAFGGIFLWLALTSLTQAALVRMTIAHSEGRASSIVDSIVAALRAFVPLMALTVMVVVVELVGFVLLIVPGVILYCVLAVASPALVAEGIGPIAAMGRSRHLTSGGRWKVFGISLVAAIATWALAAAISAVSLQMFGGAQGLAEASLTGTIPLAYFVVQAIGQTLNACIWALLASALYVELRDWKDGPRSEALAEVFA